MKTRLTCPCGETIRAQDEDELVELTQQHLAAEHPGMSYGRDEILFPASLDPERKAVAATYAQPPGDAGGHPNCVAERGAPAVDGQADEVELEQLAELAGELEPGLVAAVV